MGGERPDDVYAHTVEGKPKAFWESLIAHLEAVAAAAARRADHFGFAELARLAGVLHDIGKVSAAFQAYLETKQGRVDHSTAGAREALRLYPELRQLLAAVIAGHHAGLADGRDLARRLDPTERPVPAYAGWEAHAPALPLLRTLRPRRTPVPNRVPGFTEVFLTRMLFSCLVDADRTETARFYGETIEGGGTDLRVLRDRLRAHMAIKRAKGAEATGEKTRALNALRAEVLDHVVARAADAPGLFTLTVPTGGGKTLASLAFALEHAARHAGMRRVVYVIPFAGARIETPTRRVTCGGSLVAPFAGARIETSLWSRSR